MLPSVVFTSRSVYSPRPLKIMLILSSVEKCGSPKPRAIRDKHTHELYKTIVAIVKVMAKRPHYFPKLNY